MSAIQPSRDFSKLMEQINKTPQPTHVRSSLREKFKLIKDDQDNLLGKIIGKHFNAVKEMVNVINNQCNEIEKGRTSISGSEADKWSVNLEKVSKAVKNLASPNSSDHETEQLLNDCSEKIAQTNKTLEPYKTIKTINLDPEVDREVILPQGIPDEIFNNLDKIKVSNEVEGPSHHNLKTTYKNNVLYSKKIQDLFYDNETKNAIGGWTEEDWKEVYNQTNKNYEESQNKYIEIDAPNVTQYNIVAKHEVLQKLLSEAINDHKEKTEIGKNVKSANRS